MCSRIGNQDTDCTKADHAKLLSLDLTACKCFFRFFCIFGNIAILFVLLYPVDTSKDISGCKQHTGDHQLFYTIGICPWCIKYNDSLLRTFVQWNIIYTGSGTGNRF